MRARSLVLAVGLLQACGDDVTTIPDASIDATVDSTPGNDSGGQDVVVTDTGNDTGTNDASDGGTVSDGGGALSHQCGDASVASCASCSGATQPCAFCQVIDASVLLGVCAATHTNCSAVIPASSFQNCPCP